MREIFLAKHILPQVYKTVLDDAFGPGWIHWLPETCWVEIHDRFKVDASSEVKNKINALKVFLTTDKFFEDAHIFENMILAVNDYHVDPDTLQLAQPEEITYGIRALQPLRAKEGHDFGREIIGYIQTSCRKAGLLRYPHVLRFAEPTYDPAVTAHLPLIEPKKFAPYDDTNIIHVQSLKLWQITQYVIRKLSHLDLENLEYSKG